MPQVLLFIIISLIYSISMTNIFYYYAIFFILRSIRAIYRSDKIGAKQNEVFQNITVFNFTDIAKQIEDIHYINNQLKKKSIWNRLFSFIDFLWLIAGSIFTFEYLSFILLIVSDVFIRFISWILKTKSQFINKIIIANLIDILIASFILYKHFFSIL